jgi:hypothetical protein
MGETELIPDLPQLLEMEWKRVILSLRRAGYEGAPSIEYEDALLSVTESFGKASPSCAT